MKQNNKTIHEMKILILYPLNPFASSSASNNRFLSLAEGLVERGCQIDLLIVGGYFGIKERAEFGLQGERKNIRYRYLIKADYSNFFIRQFFLRILPEIIIHRKVKSLLRNKRYDYLWLHDGKRIIQIGLAISKSDKKIRLYHERSEYSWIGLTRDDKTHQQYLNEFLPNLDAMAVMTRTLGDYYKQFVGSQTKMVHLPMTVDLSRFNNVVTTNNLHKPYIAYCGAMNNKKDGVDILIQSFIKIKDEFPDLHLYLAGPLQPEKDYWMQRELIGNSNCENRVSYLGNLSRDEMPVFLYNASVLALARPESRQAEGGFPTKLGEYLATGKPVCVTKVGEIGDYLKDEETAYMAEPSSIDSFENALRRALTDSKASIIGENGKQTAYRHFNKDVQAELLYQFLFENK